MFINFNNGGINMNSNIVVIAVMSLLLLGAIVLSIRAIIISAKNRDRQIDTDIHCKFTNQELYVIEAVMKKYRCTFDELILLGTWRFQDEGRNIFDLIDDRRADMNPEPEKEQGMSLMFRRNQQDNNHEMVGPVK
jgi:hypothetical protein